MRKKGYRILKIAMTIIQETGRISPMYDSVERILCIRSCRCGKISEEWLDFPSRKDARTIFFIENNIRTIITGAISNEDLAELNGIGIQVLPFAAGQWEEIWREWNGKHRLSPRNLMPGCCDHHRKCCARIRKGGIL